MIKFIFALVIRAIASCAVRAHSLTYTVLS